VLLLTDKLLATMVYHLGPNHYQAQFNIVVALIKHIIISVYSIFFYVSVYLLCIGG